MVTAAPPLRSVGRVPLASSPTAVAPRPAQGLRQRPLVFLPLPFRFQGQEVQEGLLIPFTAVSFLPAKNLIFLQDTKNNFKFLVDSDVSLSVLPHTSTGPPTGPHLVGANGKPIPAWGFRCRTVCFSGQNFEFDFLLAAVATPLLGMDFLAKFGLLIIPSKQQVLHDASACTFSKTSNTSYTSLWSPETDAAVAALPPQVQKLLEEFPSLLRPSATPPKLLHGVVHHIDTGSTRPRV
jgi:hypothetical protein